MRRLPLLLVLCVGPLALSAGEYSIDANARCYVHFKRRTNLSLSLNHPAGRLLGVDKKATEVAFWKDDRGRMIASKKANSWDPVSRQGDKIDFPGFSSNNNKSSVSVGMNKVVAADAKSCKAKGVLVIRFGSDIKSGEAKNIQAKQRTKFQMGGVPFTVHEIKKWPFKDSKGRTRHVISITCPYGKYGTSSPDFVDNLSLCDAAGKVISERVNQKSTFSDMRGNKGYMYNWIVPAVPNAMNIRYKLYGKLETVKVPFNVSAKIER